MVTISYRPSCWVYVEPTIYDMERGTPIEVNNEDFELRASLSSSTVTREGSGWSIAGEPKSLDSTTIEYSIVHRSSRREVFRGTADLPCGARPAPSSNAGPPVVASGDRGTRLRTAGGAIAGAGGLGGLAIFGAILGTSSSPNAVTIALGTLGVGAGVALIGGIIALAGVGVQRRANSNRRRVRSHGVSLIDAWVAPQSGASGFTAGFTVAF
jgi:hypothetical protein